jgi:hypothetical protein
MHGCEHAMLRVSRVTVQTLCQVPDGITDLEATFTEPLAAACRILEQQVHFCLHAGMRVTSK